MQELSKLILAEYQVRKTKEQKTKFIELLQKELKDHTIQVEEGGFVKSRNIVVGDLEKCEMVLGAHYDTAPVLPFPNFLAPKNMVAYIGYSILLMLGLFAFSFVLAYVAMLLTKKAYMAFIFSYAGFFLLIGWMFVGKANKHTANDNTSGVITLIEALHHEGIKDKVCCVFFDHEEVGLFGSAFFAKKHKDILKDKLVINFDCVSDGDHIMFVINKKAEDMQSKLEASFIEEGNKKMVFTKSSNTLYPSDQMNFKKNIGVAAFKRAKLIGYYMDRIHTKKDIIFDEKNIEIIVKGLEKLVS